MFRNIVYSTCCLAWLLSTIGLTKDLNAMDALDRKTNAESRATSLLPISVDFQYFICSATSSEPSKWPTELNHISSNISFLLEHHDSYDLSVAYPILHGLSSYSFNRFAKFCCSDFCDHTSRSIIVGLFGLFLLTIAKSDSVTNIDQLRLELEIIRDKFKTSNPINLEQSKSVFDDMFHLIHEISPEMYE